MSAHVRGLLQNWFQARPHESVRFLENLNPKDDPQASYVVTYEARFEPDSLDRARLEVWATDEGLVSIGFETRERIAARLGTSTGSQKRFAGGHEPVSVRDEGLNAILEFVASGGVSVKARVVPFLGLVGTRAVVEPGARRVLRASGYNHLDWLREVPRSRDRSGVLRYRAW